MARSAPRRPRAAHILILLLAATLPLLVAGCAWLAPPAVPEPAPPATLLPAPTSTPAPAPTPTRPAPTPSPSRLPGPSPTSAAPQERTPAPTADPLAALEGGVTLAFWHPLDPDSAAAKLLAALVAEFEQVHPEVRVEVTAHGSESALHRAILLALAEGTGPDLALAAPPLVADYARRGAVAPLGTYIADPSLAPAAAVWEDLYPGAHPAGTGDLYLWPYAQHAVGLWYNLDLLRAAGHTAPPRTWEEFEALSRAVVERTDAAGYGHVPGGRLAAAWLASAGEELVSADGRRSAFAGPAGAEVLALLGRLAAEEYSSAYDTPAAARQAFATGQVAMLAGSTGDLAELRRAIGAAGNIVAAWGQLPLPRRANTPQGENAGALLYGDGLCILQGEETQRLAAWLLLRFLAEPRQAAQWAKMGYLPLSASAGEYLADHMSRSPVARQQFVEIAPHARAEPGVRAWREVEDYLLEALLSVERGVADPAEALAHAAALADDALAR